jgi:hypothetical protein
VTKPFTVIRAKLEPRPKLAEVSRAEPIIVEAVDPRRDDQRKRDKRAKALAAQAFRNWRPGM